MWVPGSSFGQAVTVWVQTVGLPAGAGEGVQYRGANSGGARRVRRWHVVGWVCGARAVAGSAVYALWQAWHGGLAPADQVTVLGFPLAVVGVVGMLVAFRKPRDGTEADLEAPLLDKTAAPGVCSPRLRGWTRARPVGDRPAALLPACAGSRIIHRSSQRRP
jgi:hypothetical protein